MSTLNKLIRLAHSKPETRKELLPLIQKYAYQEIPEWAYMALRKDEKKLGRAFMTALNARDFNTQLSRWGLVVHLDFFGGKLDIEIGQEGAYWVLKLTYVAEDRTGNWKAMSSVHNFNDLTRAVLKLWHREMR